ncbi:MAG TPA: hypothetical protein VF174_15410 [Micromonosporaceae bacterium]
MSEQPNANEQELDVEALTRDELLLDALGRGEPASDGDEVARLLAAWRADLVGDTTGDVEKPPPAARRARSRPPGRRDRIGTGRRSHRILLAAAGLLVALGGMLTAAAGSAGPDSPLWPITRLVYEERAESRLAQRDARVIIERARQAVAEGRYTDAEHLLDDAAELIGRVRDPQTADRLLAEVAVVRRLLPGNSTGSPGMHTPGSDTSPPAPPTAAPSTPAAGATPSTGPTGSSAPSPSRSDGGLPLPDVPLPTGSPLPSLDPTGVLPDLPDLPS